MYHQYYSFFEDPFLLSPNHKFCHRHPSFSEAMANMECALDREEGFVVITGEPGTGKTTLIDDLLENLDRSDINIAKLTGARLDEDDILSMVGYAFRIPVDDMDKVQTLHRIQQYTESDFRRGRRSLLIVDEAQGLTRAALEELRLLVNLRIDGKPLLQIFLIGQEELREQLMDKRLEQLNQQIVAACHLESLTLEQTTLYVLYRLRVAGWQGNPKLNPKLFPFLHEFSQGIPRRINIACSRVLLHGALEERSELTDKEIRLVISELQTEHLYSADSFNLKDIKGFDLEHLAELIDQNTPKDSVPISAQGIEKKQSPTQQLDRSSPTPQEQVVQPEHVSPPERAEQSGQPEMPIPGMQGKRRKMGIGFAPLWGFAATLLLALSILILGLILTSPQELRRIAPESFWAEIGVTKIRGLVFRWTDGTLPLQQFLQSVQKVSQNPKSQGFIERRDKPQASDIHTGLLDPSMEEGIQVAHVSIPQKEIPREKAKVIPQVKSEPQKEIPQKKAKVIPETKSDTGIKESKTNPDRTKTPSQEKSDLRTVMQVAFRFDSAEIQAKFQEPLNEIASSLNARKEITAHIIGFTDSVGDQNYNARLSERRALAVANYLRKKGVSEPQLQIEGRGEMELQGGLKEMSARSRVVRVYTKSINKSLPTI